MLLESLQSIFRRDLGAARREVAAYPDEVLIWAAVPGLPNSAGVLVRHVTGNLQHYVGAVLGDPGYRRDREAEFTAPPWPRSRLIAELTTTEAVVARTLAALAPDRLASRYPESVAQRELGTADFLVHLAVHCGFHLGQIGYHRRAATGSALSIGPMGIAALATARPIPPGA